MAIVTRTDAIPSRFTGAWLRRSIAYDGGPPQEAALAVWVQSSSEYADLRLPTDVQRGDAPSCCAGRTRWDGWTLRWSHGLDLDRFRRDEVVGEVSFDGDLLRDVGTARRPAGPCSYHSVWERQPGSDGIRLAMRREDGRGRLVQAGDHVMTIVDQRPIGGPFRACYRRRTSAGWTVFAELGPDPDELPEPPPVHTIEAGTVTIGAKRWLLVEATDLSEAA